MTFNASQPFVDSDGRLTQRARTALATIESWIPIVGSGSPEGVVEAQQYRVFIRSDGTTGTLMYVKKSADIGGDKSQGWVAV